MWEHGIKLTRGYRTGLNFSPVASSHRSWKKKRDSPCLTDVIYESSISLSLHVVKYTHCTIRHIFRFSSLCHGLWFWVCYCYLYYFVSSVLMSHVFVFFFLLLLISAWVFLILFVSLSSSSCQFCCHPALICVSPVAAFQVLVCSWFVLGFCNTFCIFLCLLFCLPAFLLPVFFFFACHFIVCIFRFWILGCWTWLRHTFCWITCLPVVLCLGPFRVTMTDLF